ncbi:MAG: hypothetical protein EOR30_18175 [Mesorhizobium sp.]|nr:hypothetical protein EOA78_13270 [Mesorhizobium sp. M5C.F.Cr.IN.023.01.1.1]RWF83824.1 MAG: hypothetical protein EOQ36_26700 [Mesorhizobium sp.]RWF93268.1 MAG: hypothetical protein EOQ45_18035 [Mesorhizobium sp.]RWH38509.1 MAG: hypothetical protein EOQ80_30230 [Mesorhizobium sp.]RWI40640.1 MAG: hypothetical protein EOR14_12815 [Mesorhizobium sp.]
MPKWQKLREREEALDCRVVARSAAWIVGADRWPESTWRDLEAQFGKNVAALAPTPTAAITAPPLAFASNNQNTRPQNRQSRPSTERPCLSRWME